MNTTPLSCQKHLFSLPKDSHYLNCAYMSPLSHRVEAAGLAGVRRKSVPAQITPADFFREGHKARDLFAQLVNASPEHIALVPSVSYGMATVAKNLQIERGPRAKNRIVTSAEQFPSNMYVWRRLRDAGADLQVVSAPEGTPRYQGWNEALLEAIDETTTLVALPHVHWADGTRFDLEAIGAKAREVGAALIIDGTQSLGALPFDVAKLQPDALIAGSYKTLMGPYGLGFAYYGEQFLDGTPLEETWIARRGSEDFSRLVDYQDEYADGAVRFDVGERSNPILLPMLVAALEELLERRPERVQAYCADLFREPIRALCSHGYRVEDEASSSRHLFGVRLPQEVDLETLRTALEARHIYVSVRGDAVRVAPNVYNDEADAAALVEVLTEVIG